jgi:hypothetical protein
MNGMSNLRIGPGSSGNYPDIYHDPAAVGVPPVERRPGHTKQGDAEAEPDEAEQPKSSAATRIPVKPTARIIMPGNPELDPRALMAKYALNHEGQSASSAGAYSLKDIFFTQTQSNPWQAEHYFNSTSRPLHDEVLRLLEQSGFYWETLRELKLRHAVDTYANGAEYKIYGVRLSGSEVKTMREHCTIFMPTELQGVQFDVVRGAEPSLSYDPHKWGTAAQPPAQVEATLGRLNIPCHIADDLLTVCGTENIFRVAANGGLFNGARRFLETRGLAREMEKDIQGEIGHWR